MRLIILAILSLIFISSPARSEVLKLIPAGDSITYGTGDSPLFGYRDHLQDSLDHDYDFVGPFTDPDSSVTYDVDHMAQGGQRTDQVEVFFTTYLSTYMSDVDGQNSSVLLHVGHNDIIQAVDDEIISQATIDTAVGNVEDIIDYIHAFNPDIDIYVALIIPTIPTDYNGWITTYNTYLSAMLTAHSKENIYTVNMNAAIKADPSWATNLMSDFAHPNDAGYTVMAQTWAAAINENYSGIVVSRTTGVAPLFVSFEETSGTVASTSESKPFHDLDFTWSFGDSGSGNWGTDGESKNSARGAVAAHVFETPGTYTVTVTVKNSSGTVSTDTKEIVVSDPSTVYAGTLTTCVNNVGDSDFSGCPSGANQINSDDPTSATVINSAGDGERLLFKRGYTASLATTPAWPKSDGPVTIGAYGTCTSPNSQGICSNNPVFTITGSEGFINIDYMRDLRVMDIKTLGSFNYGGASDLRRVTFLRIDSENALGGTSMGWGHWNDSTPMTLDQMAIVDCRVINSDEYGVYVGGEKIGLMGNVFSISGTTHLVRVWQAYKSLISHNTFDSANVSNSNMRPLLKLHGPDDVEEDVEHCPLTGSTSCLVNYTQFTIVSDNVFGAAGGEAVAIAPQSAYADSEMSDIIFERNKILRDWGTYNAGSNFNLGVLAVGSYLSIRNNIVDMSHGQADARGITLKGDEYIYLEHTIGNMIYNNTIYRSEAVGDYNYGVEIYAGVEGTVLRNNLVSFPLATGPRAAVLDDGTGTVSSNNILTVAPGFIDPNNSDPLLRDFDLSADSTEAIGHGYTIPMLDDFAGGIRAVPYDVGAFAYGEATPIPGVCGDESPTPTAPTVNRCSSGTAGTVSLVGGNWVWPCYGINSNIDDTCSAAYIQPAGDGVMYLLRLSDGLFSVPID